MVGFEEVGIPGSLIPAPFPFLPLPKGLINEVGGLGSWRAYVLKEDNIVEDIGQVWGVSREEAEEAAENIVEVELGNTIFGDIKAVGVVKE